MKAIVVLALMGISSVAALGETVSLKDGSKIVGSVVSTDSQSVTVQSASLGRLTILKSEIAATPVAAAPKPVPPAWSGSATSGYLQSQTAKLTSDLNLGAAASRDDSTGSLYLNSSYRFTTDKDKKGRRNVTNNNVELDSRYEWKLPASAFAYLSADFEHDSVNEIALRMVGGVGIGKKLISNKATQLKSDVGLSHVSYDFLGSVPSAEFNSLTFGLQAKQKLSSATTLIASLAYHPSVDAGAKYHFSGSLAVQTAITSSWFLNLQFVRKYDSISTANGRKDTSKWNLGIGYRF